MKKTAAYTCAALLTAAVLAVPVTVSTAATQSAVSVTADKLQYDGENKKKYKCDYVSEELSDLAKGEVADITIYFESEE